MNKINYFAFNSPYQRCAIHGSTRKWKCSRMSQMVLRRWVPNDNMFVFTLAQAIIIAADTFERINPSSKGKKKSENRLSIVVVVFFVFCLFFPRWAISSWPIWCHRPRQFIAFSRIACSVFSCKKVPKSIFSVPKVTSFLIAIVAQLSSNVNCVGVGAYTQNIIIIIII